MRPGVPGTPGATGPEAAEASATVPGPDAVTAPEAPEARASAPQPAPPEPAPASGLAPAPAPGPASPATPQTPTASGTPESPTSPDSPESPDAPARTALDLPGTAAGLGRARRHASYCVNAGLALLAAALTVVVASASASAEELAAVLGPWCFSLGAGALGLGLWLRGRVRRMRQVLGSRPWTAYASVAVQRGGGSAAVVLAGGPRGDELLVLAPLTTQWRYHLLTDTAGVLWWCGDPRSGGVLAPPGGEELIRARPLGARRARRTLDLPQVRALSHRPSPRPPHTTATGPHPAADRPGSPWLTVPPEKPARRRPGLTWLALLVAGLAGVVLATVWAEQSESDPRIDLTVLSEQSDGRCVVRWDDPFDHQRRTGTYRCDPDRGPLLDDWETGFVVSYGPWKGDLYNADLEGTSAFAVMDTVGVGGLLCALVGLVGGAVRLIRRGGRAAVGPLSAPAYAGVAPLSGPPWVPGGPGAPPLTYAVCAAAATRQAALRGPDAPPGRPGAGVRTGPWWRVPVLLKATGLTRVLFPLACPVGIGTLTLVRPGTVSGPVQVLAVVFGALGLYSLLRILRGGVPLARQLTRQADGPVAETPRYVLLEEPSGAGPDPVLLLFAADADDSAPPRGLLRLLAPGPRKRPWAGLPAPVGTAELRGRREEPFLPVPWIDGRPHWPADRYEELDLSDPETVRYLEELVPARL
ncbi:hypothetical protein [Streptomyces sp. NRRL WC-3549]|uniref:hypothetical protein n=1 Tax=Streptomyces sp. NRRL WC-3549 TaxID=1463925 RepID=UPI00131CE25D|nr:hypothetical protein [Streptomyces sp. NRRL WC-3549]